MRYPNQEKLNPGDLWRWCNYRADTVSCSEQIEADQHGWRQAADLIHSRGVELAQAAGTIERLTKERDDVTKTGAECAKQLVRAMGNIARSTEALERLEKERDAHQKAFEEAIETASKACAERDTIRTELLDTQGRLHSVKETRDHLAGEVERLKKERDDLNTENLRVMNLNMSLGSKVDTLQKDVKRIDNAWCQTGQRLSEVCAVRDEARAEVALLKKENGKLRETLLDIPYGSADELAERYKGMED